MDSVFQFPRKISLSEWITLEKEKVETKCRELLSGLASDTTQGWWQILKTKNFIVKKILMV